MSEDIEKFIPTDPGYVPDLFSQEQAVRFLKGLVPPQDSPYMEEITATTTEYIEFVDQGENFERVLCPICSSELPTAWWQDAMDKAYEEHFADLNVTTPCCNSWTTLNDLLYEWPAGFARFVLQIREPYYRDAEGVGQPLHLTAEQHRTLQDILKCDLRTIWAHY